MSNLNTFQTLVFFSAVYRHLAYGTTAPSTIVQGTSVPSTSFTESDMLQTLQRFGALSDALPNEMKNLLFNFLGHHNLMRQKKLIFQSPMIGTSQGVVQFDPLFYVLTSTEPLYYTISETFVRSETQLSTKFVHQYIKPQELSTQERTLLMSHPDISLKVNECLKRLISMEVPPFDLFGSDAITIGFADRILFFLYDIESFMKIARYDKNFERIVMGSDRMKMPGAVSRVKMLTAEYAKLRQNATKRTQQDEPSKRSFRPTVKELREAQSIIKAEQERQAMVKRMYDKESPRYAKALAFQGTNPDEPSIANFLRENSIRYHSLRKPKQVLQKFIDEQAKTLTEQRAMIASFIDYSQISSQDEQLLLKTAYALQPNVAVPTQKEPSSPREESTVTIDDSTVLKPMGVLMDQVGKARTEAMPIEAKVVIAGTQSQG